MCTYVSKIQIHIFRTRFSHFDVSLNIHSVGWTGFSFHSGQVVTIALLRKQFTRVQHWPHTRRVYECQLFLRSVLWDGISCLDQRSSFTLSSTPSKILLSQFSRNRHQTTFSTQKAVPLSWKVSFYRTLGLVNNKNISHMVAVSLLQVKKLRWGKLSQISQGKLSAPKYCKISDENYK